MQVTRKQKIRPVYVLFSLMLFMIFLVMYEIPKFTTDILLDVSKGGRKNHTYDQLIDLPSRKYRLTGYKLPPA